MKRLLCLLVLLLACGVAFAADNPATDAAVQAEPNLAVCPADGSIDEVKGKPEPPASPCCDPALEPGANGNPFCFEGHLCCYDGRWSCNNPDGSPSCKTGEVCVDCASTGDSCSTNAECCSGRCKGGRCR